MINRHIDKSRRNFLKTTAVVSSVGALATGSVVSRANQSDLEINVAGYDYDRVKGIMDGRAGIDGAEVRFHYEDIYSVNRLAFGPEKTYEVSELGLIPYVNKFINEDFRDYTLIPIFISRVFRHRNVFVRVGSGIEKPEDLKGRRVGTPGYGMSAMTWIRGFLKDEYGVEAADMQWIETTKSSDAGELQGSGWNSFRPNGSLAYFLPPGFPLVKGPPGVDEVVCCVDRLNPQPRTEFCGCQALIAAFGQMQTSDDGQKSSLRRPGNPIIHHNIAMQFTTARLDEANIWLCRQRTQFPPDADICWFRRC